MEIHERPAHYQGPNLDPSGVKLYPRFLAPGVYALMANRVPRDNSGVVIGSRGALVIDSGSRVGPVCFDLARSIPNQKGER